MKIYLLQEYISETDEIIELDIYYKKPSIKELFESLTSESYDLLSEECREESLAYLGLTMDSIKLDLMEEGVTFNDTHMFYLKKLELNNKDILNNINEKIHILSYTNREELSSSIENIIIGDIVTEDMIDKQIIEDIKERYVEDEYNNEKQAIKELLEGKNVWIDEYDGVFEWTLINLKNINKMEE